MAVATDICTTVKVPHLVFGDKRFDDQFEIWSALIPEALNGRVADDADADHRCKALPECKDKPEYWGIRVSVLVKLWHFISSDLQEYAASHLLDKDYNHICLASPCGWHHHNPGKVMPLRESADRKTRRMQPDMNLVVQRYVKPWTREFHKAGLALVLNAGFLAISVGRTIDAVCRARAFVSHCWQEVFGDFVATLQERFDADTICWICSFGIWQHGAIGDALTDVEACPFAQAIRQVDLVVMVTDRFLAAPHRCWCVLEAKLTVKWQKPYSIALPNDDPQIMEEVNEKLKTIDVRQCQASVSRDKELIIKYCEFSGGVDEVNDTIRQVSLHAFHKAQWLLACKTGDTEYLNTYHADDIGTLKTSTLSCTTHLLARFSQVAAMREYFSMVNKQLDWKEWHGRTPLSLAAGHGSLASVHLLITLRSDLHSRSEHDLTPLHFASAAGHHHICELLVLGKADLEARGCYALVEGHTPLTVAGREGQSQVLKTLLALHADIRAEVCGLTALCLAAKLGHAEAALVLITAKANINVQGAIGFGPTPIMRAVVEGRTVVAGLLVGAKADLHLSDRRGKTVQTCYDEYALRDPEGAWGLHALLFNLTGLSLSGAPSYQGSEIGEIGISIPDIDDGIKPVKSNLSDILPTTCNSDIVKLAVKTFARFDRTGSGFLEEHCVIETFRLLLGDAGKVDSDIMSLVWASNTQTAGKVDYVAFLNWLFPAEVTTGVPLDKGRNDVSEVSTSGEDESLRQQAEESCQHESRKSVDGTPDL
eukprot:TRINITY_DN108305_c0_g1_i1.p1 TRINITY_DN108305_c0_g1~~TRINITY_DN108305_c0_g1_i1.p1  ORF type:complete len:780 (-),score=97.72 TRINITY_DN108305_c0_g1_i1:35-2332(-)